MRLSHGAAVFLLTLSTAVAFRNAVDSQGKCDGGPFAGHGNNRSSCLPYVTEYGGKCMDTAQCEWLGENAVCYSSVCLCKEQHRWYQGMCRKYVGLNEKCTEDLDCYDGYNPQALSCNNNKCTCSTGYYKRGNVDCRKIASKIGDICALNADCQFETGEKGQCLLGKCVKPTSNSQWTSYSYLLENEESPIPPPPPPFDKMNRKKQVDTHACNQTSDCAKIPNSECYNKSGTCACKKSYFFNDQRSACLAEIGTKTGCKNDTDCPILPGKCVNGTCFCRDYYFLENGNRNCIKTMSEQNPNCLSREWCYAWGTLSYCSSNGTCHCSKVSDFDKSQESCVSNGRNDSSLCRSDLECTFKTRNSVCIDEKCQCANNYRLEHDKCLPNIGAVCDTTESICTMKNSICSESKKICECTDNFVADANRCFPVRNLGDACQITKQCSSRVPHSQCANSTCLCSESYLKKDNSCMKIRQFGDYCGSRLECTLSLDATFECRNSKCQCATNAKYIEARNQCSSSNVTTAVGSILLTMVFLLNTFK